MRFIISALAACALGFGSSERADAATHVSGTIGSNATWTIAGSPYILDGSVTVAAGATLTIEPGVVIKFNGSFRYLWVEGSLQAIGTPETRITFTSIQDDSIGGDDGGDGGTTGAPGQWYNIDLRPGSATSVLSYVDVRYGGYGSPNWNYGAVSVSSSAHVLVDNARITDNEASGIKVGSGGAATIESSQILRNGSGVSVNAAQAEISGSIIADNSQDGVWLNLPTLSSLPPASTLTASDVTRNGRYGVFIEANGDYPLASMPTGTGNNIYANLYGSGEQLVVSGYPTFKEADVNWRGNYWGEAYSFANPSECASTAPYAAGRPAFRSGGGTPPAGPVSGGTYTIWHPYPQPTTVCGYSAFKIPECAVATSYINRGIVAVELEQPKLIGAAMTCVGDASLGLIELERDVTSMTEELTAGYLRAEGQTTAQVVADYESTIESLIDTANAENSTTHAHPADATVNRMLLSTTSVDDGWGLIEPFDPCGDVDDWWPTTGRIYVGQSPGASRRYVYQQFTWTSTSLGNLQCFDNITYEPDANFHTEDGLHYLGNRKGWFTNLPRGFKDKPLLDSSPYTTYTVGTSDAQLLDPGVAYWTVLEALPGNTSTDVAWATGQSGFRWLPCHHWFCIDGRESQPLTGDFDVPGGENW